MFTRCTDTNLFLKPANAENRVHAVPNADLVGSIESIKGQLDVVAFRGVCIESGKASLAVSIGAFRQLNLNVPTFYCKLFEGKNKHNVGVFNGYFEIPHQHISMVIEFPEDKYAYEIIVWETYDASGNFESYAGSAYPAF